MKFRRFFRLERLEERQLLANDFTLAVLPDTQKYTESFPAIFDAQTQWIVDNLAAEKIAFVSHMGDMVETPSDPLQWQRGSSSISILDGDLGANPDGLVPYSVAIGNHDYDEINNHASAADFVSNFGASRYAGRSWYGGSSLDELNHYQTFSAGGYDFLHITVEWEPRDSAIAWAQNVIDSHPGMPTILTTHAYLHRSDGHSQEMDTPDGRSGQAIFEDFVRINPQIFMVLNGHFGGEGHQISTNDAGLPVFEMLANYQNEPNGGNSWLRLIDFDLDSDRIDVTTYSPTLNQFETDQNSQFTFFVDFAQRFDIDVEPFARLIAPADNSLADSDPLVDSVRTGGPQSEFRLQLTDFFSSIDDSTVTASTVAISRDGNPLSSGGDYTFSYDSANDQVLLTASSEFDSGLYEISLSAGAAQIFNIDGDAMQPSTLTVEVDSSLPPPPNELYFAVDSLVTLNGGSLTADDEDVITYNGAIYSILFDGSDVGLSLHTIDALALYSPNELLLSFTSEELVPGISDPVDDSDIVKFTATQLGDTTAGEFSMFFDGSDVGLSGGGEDIDGFSVLTDGRLVVGVRGSFSAGGVTGEDEDLFVFDPVSLGDDTAGSWAMYFDGSDVGLEPEDINATSVYPSGEIYLSTKGSFDLGWVWGADSDVFTFTPQTLGDDTAGTFRPDLYFDSSEQGLGNTDIYALHIPLAGPPNQLPIAEDDDAAVLEDGAVAIDLLADNGHGADRDDDGTLDPASITPVAGPANGELVNHGDGTVTYTPDADFFGVDQFSYTVRDTLGGVSNEALVTITVTSVNDPPVAEDDFVATMVDTSVLIDVLNINGNGPDSDVDGVLIPSSVTITNLPSQGGVVNHSDGTVTYTPNSGFLGTDSFTYTVEDDQGAVSNEAQVTINVSNAPTESLFFTLNQTMTLPGGVIVEDEDIAMLDNGSFLQYFDGSDVGVDGQDLNAFAILNSAEILLTFKSPTIITGVAQTVDPYDIVKFTATQLGSTTAGTFELYFDGWDVGLNTSAEEIDALDLLPDGRIVISTRGTADANGVIAKDDDLLAFSPATLGEDTTGTWELYFDGSQVESGVGDIDAVAVAANGDIYMSDRSTFAVTGVSGEDEDVFIFQPTSLGAVTAGTYVSQLAFDGSAFGLEASDLSGVDIAAVAAPPAPAAPAESSSQGATVSANVSEAEGTTPTNNTEPEPTEPEPTEPVATEPEPTEPVATEPEPTEPEPTEPVATEPEPTEPVATEPVATEPVATEPVATEPVATEPVATEPVATEPVPTEPMPTEPMPTEPEPTEPEPTEPEPTEPEPTEPEPTEPVATEPDQPQTTTGIERTRFHFLRPAQPERTTPMQYGSRLSTLSAIDKIMNEIGNESENEEVEFSFEFNKRKKR